MSGWFVLPLVNYLVEKQFILSKGTHVFLMAHLVDTGILEEFLSDKCASNEFQDCSLCQHKDNLPKDLATFIWSGDILSQTGGWTESEEEYNKIIRATLKEPKYLIKNIFKSVSYGLVQLTRNEIGQGLTAYNEGSTPYGQIHWRFRSEVNNYLNSRQNQWNGVNLKFDTLNKVHTVLLWLSLLSLLGMLATGVINKIDPVSLLFLGLGIATIIINAFVTAGLNSPCSRFQARVVWLLPFALIVLIIRNYDQIKIAFKDS